MAKRATQTRKMESREATERKAPGTRYKHKLFIPDEIIAAEKRKGFGVRWIAMTVHNHPLDNNVESRLMNGWQPLRADEYPKLLPPIVLPGREAPQIITRGGQILCRKPLVDIEADREEVRRETMDDLQSVNWSNKDNKTKELGDRVVDTNSVRIERVTSRSNAGFADD